MICMLTQPFFVLVLGSALLCLRFLLLLLEILVSPALHFSHLILPSKVAFLNWNLRFYLFIFREKGREGGREGENH